jgi:hypothetical protein
VKRRKQSTARGGKKSTLAISEEDAKALAELSRSYALANKRAVVERGAVSPPRVFYDVTADARAKARTEAPKSQELPADLNKRGSGRPSNEYILNAVKVAAWAKAETGKYRWIAPQLNVSANQLSDWVRNHPHEFDQWVAQYKKDKLPS